MPITRSDKHQCPTCGKGYERVDHLNRHLRSHENARSFRCTVCQKGYNRADLLHRHQTKHLRASSVEGRRRLERAAQACSACIAAKSKCEDEKPCNRCRLKSLQCEVLAVRPRAGIPQHSMGGHSISVVDSASPSANLNWMTDGHLESGGPTDSLVMESEYQPSAVAIPQKLPPGDAEERLYPDFLDRILQTRGPDEDTSANIGVYTHPDVSNFLQDLDFQFSDLDYPAIDLAMFGDLIPTNGFQPHRHATALTESRTRVRPQVRPGLPEVSSRSDAFKRSPWIHWNPNKHHHSFTGQDELNVDNGSLSVVEPPYASSPGNPVDGHNLDADARDGMLAIVIQASISKFSVPSFPSLDLLKSLIRAYFVQEGEAITNHIHSPTFGCGKARPELNLAIVAAGASAIPVRDIQKMGLVLHEVIRLAVAELWERDNSSTRDLQALQAYLTCLELGTWSGIKRKVEIACAFIQVLCILVKQTGRMGAAYYARHIPPSEVGAGSLEMQWRAWVDVESFKRLAIRLFIHDSQVSMAFLQPPAMCYAHMTLPVPAASYSWLAADAEAWKRSMPPKDAKPSNLSLIDVFADLTSLDEHCNYADVRLCCLVAIHALANQVWELRQQTVLLNSPYGHKQTGLQSLCWNRKRDLYENLIAVRAYCERRVPHYEISFVIEYLMMSLHVSLEDVQCFAGKNGEDEARRAVPGLREWVQSSTSRSAIWHAGQVFRMARSFPPFALRNFYVVGVYHAALTMWVYSLLRSNSERQSGTQTPVYVDHNPSAEATSTIHGIGKPTSRMINLDQTETLDVRAFVVQDQGHPGLYCPVPRRGSNHLLDIEPGDDNSVPFRSIMQPRVVMEVAIEVLRSNLLFCSEDPPHLVQSLVNLMTDLGSLTASLSA